MERPHDDFKWFGEGFDGFPKKLPEDCMEYTIYIIDSKLQDSEIHEQLRQVQTAGTELTNKLLKDFIWQREGIQLNLKYEGGEPSAFTLPATSGTNDHSQVDVSSRGAPTMATPWKMNGLLYTSCGN